MSDKRVAAVFILQDDGAVLFQLRDNIPSIRHPGKWTIPGGHSEKGESMESCARREVFEETSYRCGSLFPLGVFRRDDGAGDIYDLALFWTCYDGQLYQCLEGKDLRFIHPQDASTYPILDFLFSHWDSAVQAMKSSKQRS